MPVFINELITDVPQGTEGQGEAPARENSLPVSPPEYELLDTLKLIEERQQRLEFD